MLRLTTKVTVSPASSARSSSAAHAHRLDRLRARLGEHRGQLLRGEALAVTGLLDRRPDEVRVDRERRLLPARSAARDEAPVPLPDGVEHALGDPFAVEVLRVDAEPLGQRDAVRVQALAHLRAATGTGARARCGRRWPTGRRGRSRPRRRARATTRRGSAGPGSRRRASAGACARSGPSCRRSSPRTPTPAAARQAGRRSRWPSTRARSRLRSPPARGRSSARAARSSAGSPPGGGRARRARRPAPPATRSARRRSPRCRRGSRS